MAKIRQKGSVSAILSGYGFIARPLLRYRQQQLKPKAYDIRQVYY